METNINATEVVKKLQITGCAAQHCYNGDVRFLWENLEFDLL